MRWLVAIPVGLALVAAVARGGPSSLLENSPFIPVGEVATKSDENQALATLEFTGVFAIGKKPSFSLHDTTTNRSFWIDLGQTVEGITASAYDPESRTVTIAGRGGVRALPMKEVKITSAPVARPGPAPSSVASVGYPPRKPARPLTIAEQLPPNLTPEQRKQRTAEIDARMMVSDILEVGQQERLRYQEEKLRRAAQGQPQAQPGIAPAP